MQVKKPIITDYTLANHNHNDIASGGTISWSAISGSTTSANLLSMITDEIGSGQVVFSTGATMVNTIISGLTVNTINGLNPSNFLTYVAWTGLTGSITSAQLATALTNEIGSGQVVFSTGATMVNTIISGLTVNTINGQALGSNAFNSIAYQPLNTSLNSITALTYSSASFVKMTASNTFSLDTNTYIASTIQIIANTGTGSIIGGGDLSTNRTHTLVNDSVSPGNSMVYGTNSGGTKGWYTSVVTTSPIYLTQGFTGQTSVVVTHNLGVYPLVQLLDTTNTMFIPLNIVYNSLNQFTVTFSTSTSGTIIYSVGGVSVVSETTINQTISGITGQIVFYSGTTVSGDTSFIWDNTNKKLKIGITGSTLTDDNDHAILATISIPTYYSMDIQNLSNSISGSTDFITNADTATDSTNYLDLGINSSAYGDKLYSINSALGGYLYTMGGDLSIGTGTATKTIKFHTGGNLSSNLRGTISDIGFTSTGIFTGISTVYTPQVNTPSGTAYTWQLFAGHKLTLTLTSSTGDVTVTTNSETAGAHSELFAIGHATLSRNITLTESGVTWVYNGVSNITTVNLGSVAATKRVCWIMTWESALICHITKMSSDDGTSNLITEFTNEYSATSGQTGFTLSHTPAVNSVVKMYINGVRISNTAISTVSTTATYNPTNNGSTALVAGDRIQIDYFY